MSVFPLRQNPFFSRDSVFKEQGERKSIIAQSGKTENMNFPVFKK
jgi:hypothetical protein